jgi:hypothetical protein
MKLAERERFELSVEVVPLRRFSKPLVSATHPPLRGIIAEIDAMKIRNERLGINTWIEGSRPGRLLESCSDTNPHSIPEARLVYLQVKARTKALPKPRVLRDISAQHVPMVTILRVQPFR